MYFYEKSFFNLDETYILSEFSPFSIFRFAIGSEIQYDLNFIDKFIFEYNYK